MRQSIIAFVLTAIIALGAIALAHTATGCSHNTTTDFRDPTAFGPDESFKKIEKIFRKPDDMKLAVYWYWVNDNISAEGVEKDLRAMKEVGINRAFIGNVTADLPWGDIKIFTPEWWDVMHTALKTASDLGIEIGIFNCPGWSQSGGPWVRPEQSMRYLDCVDQTIEATGGPVTVTLDKVASDALDDVKVIAYPAQEVSSVKTTVVKHAGEKAEAHLEGTAGNKYNSLIITPSPGTAIITKGEVLAKIDEAWQKVADVDIDRSNANVNVGFMPYAPLVVALPETDATDWRLVLNPAGAGVLNVELTTRAMVERYAEKTLGKMFQTPLPMWDAYMWPQQAAAPAASCIDPAKVIDLTDKMDGDVLTWDAPAGRWTISRLAMRTTGQTNSPASPEGTGLEIDKMSQQHIQYHFDNFIGEILRRIPADDRKTFKVVVEDSYETGGLDWTDDMVEAFQERYGYDPTPYLPVMSGKVVGSRDISDRFLWDLRRLIADRVAYDYVGGLREASHKMGLSTWLECYGHWGFPGEFLQYGGQSDEVAGEFWSEGSLGDIENRAASSCAHIYGKRKVWAESCTSGGPVFSRYPRIMKQRLDRFFAEGINSTLLHLYIQQPYEDRNPGVDAWFGNEFNRKNIWFGHMDYFGRYMKRCNLMLQQGLYTADVAYFIGEDAPKMTGVCDPALPYGYSFDYINAEVLLRDAVMKDGRLTLPDGMSYSVLVLPRQSTMRPEVLSKIKSLVADGLTILGPAPAASPSLSNYPEADEQVRSLAADLWGTNNRQSMPYGFGKIYADGVTLDKVLEDKGIDPDFAVDRPEVQISFIHRAMPKGDIYFVSNQKDETASFVASFRCSGLAPQLWNPVTGEIRPLPEYTDNGTRVSVPLRLSELESAFIVFSDQKVKSHNYSSNYPQEMILADLPQGWNITFDAERRGPEGMINIETLFDWTTAGDAAIKYYSGAAHYRNSFEIREMPKGDVYIDLGSVMVMAKVKVNGRYAGGAWTYPYRVNITDCIKRGTNTLEVEVVNNWQNRIIGDMNLPAAERKVWLTVNPWTAESPLQPSGLFGPVRIIAYKL
ncbi:MAG: glycoside hydrolase family 2 [Bacteroidales bacterium]|nr:glycoside hydrolase family 2 [Bacteroidales bacterium]